MKTELYAIKDNTGNWLLESSYGGGETIIYVRTKEMCKKIIDLYYRNSGYSVAKIVKTSTVKVS